MLGNGASPLLMWAEWEREPPSFSPVHPGKFSVARGWSGGVALDGVKKCEQSVTPRVKF